MTTRVSIHCYQGDAAQVNALLPYHQRHGCPITIMSPEDSQVLLPGVDCSVVGKRQSAGQLSLDRQREQMRTLLSYPEDTFLMHDADSVLLSPEIPDYLYREPDVLWSNLVFNPIPEQQKGYAPGVPRLAFQPPYFLSRTTIERLLAVAEGVTANPVLPYIDHYMVQLAVKARVVWKGFPDGISYAICTHPGYMEKAQAEIRHQGRVFIHSVKGPRYWEPLYAAHEAWRRDYRGVGDGRLTDVVDTTAEIRPLELMTATWQGDKLIYGEKAPPPPRPRPAPQDQARQVWERQQQRKGIKA